MNVEPLFTETPVAKPTESSSFSETIVPGANPYDMAKAAEEKIAEAPAVESPVEEKFSSKFAALARKEKMAREKSKQMADERKQLSDRLKELEDFQKDPYSYLEKKDPKAYQTWTERKLKGTNEPTAEEKIREIERRLLEKEEAELKAREDSEKSQLDLGIKEVKENFEKFITLKKEDYEALFMELEEDPDTTKATLYELAWQYKKKHGKDLSYEETCQLADNYLVEKAKKRTTLKKLKPQEEESTSTDLFSNPSKPSPKSPPANPGTTKTLTNNLTSDLPNRKDKRLSMEESKERLAREFVKWD